MTAPVGSLAAYLSVRGAAQARQDILSVQRQLGLAGEAATAAGGALDRSEAALSGVGRASMVTSSRANQLRAAQLGVVSATERYNAVLADENATVGKLATSEASLIRSKERLANVTRTAAASQAEATDVTRSAALANSEMVGSSTRGAAAMGGTVKQLGLMLGGFELLKKGVDVGKETAEFQQNMLLIQTNANASAAEVSTLTAAVLKLSPDVATAPNELAKALYHIEQNGHGILTTAQMMDALRIGAEGAKVGMADVEDTTNTMTIALASGIKGMGSMQQAMGTMIAIAGTGDMRLKDLNEALSGGILSVAKGFGASLGDVAAVLATLGDNGIRGADAATALRQTLMGFAQPAKGGADALAGVGLAMHDLRDDMEKHGLVHAMNDLEKHMTAAGVTGSKVGGFITQAFGRKAGAGISVLMGEIDRLNIKFDEGAKGGASFAAKWKATTETAAFAFHKLAAEFDADAIKIATKALPAITAIGNALGVILPAGIHAAAAGMVPFIAGWHALSGILPPVAHALGDVAGFLAPLAPALKFVAADVLTMWVAFKGYQAARYAINAVADMFATVKARAAAGLASVQAYGNGVNATLSGNATESQLTSRIMQAEFARIEASALETAAAIDKAAMNEAISFADAAAASKASSDVQVAAAERAAAAATLQARESALAAATVAAAAEESALVVDEAGATAAIGWGAILGPLAAVGIGVGLLVTMFHKSSTASKEAADAAKSYTDALHDDSGKTTVVDAITQQLTDAKVPAAIAKLNKALGTSTYTGKQFVEAIQNGGPALDALRERLTIVAASNTAYARSGATSEAQSKRMEARYNAANKLLGDLNAQYSGLSETTKKDLLDTKAFAGVSSAIAKTSTATQVGSKAAQGYAEMMGIVVDKNGVAAVSAETLQAAVDKVSTAYDTATQTGDTFLTALDTFSKSAGTAADRATMIGATLKAANGDALSFAGAMTGAYAANKALADGFQADTDKIAGLKKQIKDLQNPVKGQKVDTEALTKAQNDLADAYENSEKKAINVNKGTIEYAKGGASQLVAQLQAIQDAALKAASAQFQHEKGIKGGKEAADDAYRTYKTQTLDALVSEAKHLGLTNDQAKKFATTYFGLADAKNIKKTIEAEGTDKVVDVLTRIGKMLATLTGQSWDVPVNVMVRSITHGAGAVNANSGQLTGPGFASGGYITGAGTKGVDSVPMVGAPGEFMMNDRAVDKYGLAFMKSVNNGTLKLPSGGSGVGEVGGRTVIIQHLEVNQHYPLPDTGKIALPHALRAAGTAMGGY